MAEHNFTTCIMHDVDFTEIDRKWRRKTGFAMFFLLGCGAALGLAFKEDIQAVFMHKANDEDGPVSIVIDEHNVVSPNAVITQQTTVPSIISSTRIPILTLAPSTEVTAYPSTSPTNYPTTDSPTKSPTLYPTKQPQT